MPIRLSTTVQKIFSLSNKDNSLLLSEFYEYMKSNGVSESHQNNNLKLLIAFARHLGSSNFIVIDKSESVTDFLNSKLKSIDDDPDRRCLTTWNDYLGRLKYFFRWIHNCRKNSSNNDINKKYLSPISQSEWETPVFVKIKEKKTKRLSPYSETELWERDEILSILKYEPYKRNKAALTLLWDLDARNHEITLLKIKNIRFREKYGEGEIPHEAKTGSGPVLLTCSFPYVRDWLNEHPFKNEPNARVICNLQNGAPVKPDSLWKVMRKIRKKIKIA